MIDVLVRVHRLVLMILVPSLVAACQPGLQTPTTPRSVVAVGDAVAAFEDICLDTSPSFSGAKDRFSRNGLTREGRGGIFYEVGGTMSVRVDAVDSEKGPMLRCSLVYEDPNRPIAEDRINRMIAKRGDAVGRVRNARFPTVQGGERQGRAWIYRARGRQGELIDVPHTGRGNLGVLILQFPVSRT